MSSANSQTFLYAAMTGVGKKTLGLRRAPNQDVLSEELRNQDLLLLRAWRVPLSGVGGVKSASGLHEGRMPLKDQASMAEQLHMLLSRGVPLVEALEVAASVVSERSRGRVLKMRELVGAGSSFADACRKLGGLDDVTIAVYRSAERTGDLAGAAHRLAVAARRRLAISGKAVTVMIYPAVVSTIAILLFLALLIFLVPQIARQVRQLSPKLPWISEAVFSVGEWLNSHLMLVGIVLAALVVGGLIGWRSVVSALRATLGRAGPIASLVLHVEMTRFFSVMAAMTRSGVPLADALAAATGVISGRKLRAQLEQVQKSLVEGGLLRVLIEKVDELPLATRKLLIAAERAGDLDSAFDALASDMAEEVDKKSARLLALLEPAVIVGMFALLGPLIIAIAIPLMTFRGQVGQ